MNELPALMAESFEGARMRMSNPDNPYIVYNDAPKVAHLRQEFPDLYTGK